MKNCIVKSEWYYEENKERLQKMASDQYKILSKREKNKKNEYAKN